MGTREKSGVKNPKATGISFKVSDRRRKILTDYADKHDKTMTHVIEDLIDLLEQGVIERQFIPNQQLKRKPFESVGVDRR